jgi:hypothetical protein
LGQSNKIGWTTHGAGVTELLYNPFQRAYKDAALSRVLNVRGHGLHEGQLIL